MKVFPILATGLILAMLMVISATSENRTHHIGLAYTYTYSDENRSLQEIFNGATDADTIIIDSGTFTDEYIVNGNNLSIQASDGVIFQRGYNEAVFIVNGDYNSFNNIHVNAGGFGFRVQGNGFTLTNSTIENVNVDAVDFNAGENHYLSNNLFRNISGSYCIDAGSINDSTILNNTCHNAVIGLVFNFAHNNTLRFNNITNNTYDGIHLNDNSDGNLLEFNWVYDNPRRDIYIYNSTLNIVVNNTLSMEVNESVGGNQSNVIADNTIIGQTTTTTTSTTSTSTSLPTQNSQVPLKGGWNLISIPLST